MFYPTNSNYYEVSKGNFEAALIKAGEVDKMIAFTDCDEIRITTDFEEEDRETVEEFSMFYDLEINEKTARAKGLSV